MLLPLRETRIETYLPQVPFGMAKLLRRLIFCPKIEKQFYVKGIPLEC